MLTRLSKGSSSLVYAFCGYIFPISQNVSGGFRKKNSSLGFNYAILSWNCVGFFKGNYRQSRLTSNMFLF